MFRPNRVGEHPVIAVDDNPHGFGTIGAFTHTDVQFEPMAPSATIRAQTVSEQMYGATPSILEDAGISLAVVLNGANPVGNVTAIGSAGYQLNVAGSMFFRKSTAGTQPPQIMAFIGRGDAAAVVAPGTGNNPCAHYQAIPSNVFCTADYAQISFRESLIIGAWNDAITYDDNPLFIGISIFARGSADTFNFAGSINAYKYTQDLVTFDPGRS